MAAERPNPFSYEATTGQAALVSGPSWEIVTSENNSIGLWRSILLSLGLHLSVCVLLALIFFILQFLGWNLVSFQRPEVVKDLEFQLVTTPNEKPRNPNTRNRAEHNSRSGGEKVKNMREAETHQKAGAQQPKANPNPPSKQRNPRPEKPVSKPVPVRPTQPRTTQRSYKQETTPAAPKPRVTAPKSTTDRPRTRAIPSPLAPLNVPDAPSPVATTGPVVRGPTGTGGSGSSQGSSGTLGPSTVPGQFSGGGRPSGGVSGQGGRGNYTQYGSPGGGGGRPGIDALAEPDFGPYIAELQRRIRRNWRPPDDREDKTVILVFSIARDGRLLGITTKRSSGIASADGAARAAVEASAPFRPLPKEYRNNSVSVEFTFDYNVFIGKSSGIRRQ